MAGQAWEVTKEWPQLQDCETPFKLCGKLANGARKLHDGIATLADEVTAGRISPETPIRRAAGADAKDLVTADAMLREAGATSTGTMLCLDASLAGPRPLRWWLAGLLASAGNGQGELDSWASLRMITTSVEGDGDIRDLAWVLGSARQGMGPWRQRRPRPRLSTTRSTISNLIVG